jgi:WD40 repeat protein
MRIRWALLAAFAVLAIAVVVSSVAIWWTVWSSSLRPISIIPSRSSHSVHCIRFSPCGDGFAAAEGDKTISLWSFPQLSYRFSLVGHAADIYCLAFSPDGLTLASADVHGTVRLWDTSNGAPLTPIPKLMPSVFGLAFSPLGNIVALAGGDTSHDETAGEVVLWDVRASEVVTRWKADKGSVHSITFSPDGSLVAAGMGDGSDVIIWNVQTGESRHIHALVGGDVRVAFGPEGSVVAAGRGGGSVVFFDPKRGVERFRLTGYPWHIMDFAFSPDGTTLAVAYRNKSNGQDLGLFEVWDVETRTLLRTVSAHEGNQIVSIAFSSDGSQLATAGSDCKIMFWNTESLRRAGNR